MTYRRKEKKNRIKMMKKRKGAWFAYKSDEIEKLENKHGFSKKR